MTFLDTSSPANPTPADDGEAPLRVESAWGAVTVFCLWQIFGTIIANAFVITLTGIPDDVPDHGIGLVVWCLFWIVLFIAAEESLISATRRFLLDHGLCAFAFRRSPLEWIKLLLALLSVAAWLVCFLADPFSTPGPHRLLSLAFLVFSFLVAALAKIPLGPYRQVTVPRMDRVPELLLHFALVGTVSGGLIAGGLVLGGPLGFYVLSLLGFGVLLLFVSPILLRGTILNPGPDTTKHNSASHLSIRDLNQ